MYNAIDLFSGAGGLSTGLHKAGWNVIAAIEKNRIFTNTHHYNFPTTEMIEDDVTNIDFTKFRYIDLLAGGPPCQPFSVAGRQMATNDPRNMIPHFVRAVKEARPSAFIMENVPGLVSKRHIEYFRNVLLAFHELGYRTYHRVLDAAEFGVPQHRKRLIVIGFKVDVPFDFSLKGTHGPGLLPYKTVSEALVNTPADSPTRAIVTYAKNPILRRSPYAGMLVNGAGRPIDLSRPSPTIPASAGGNRTHIVDEHGVLLNYHHHLMSGGTPRTGVVEGVRRLTLRESARLQSFDDSFVFLGTKSCQYTQVGNAVPPLLAKSIGNAVIDVFNRWL